jgi:hypothetical protein
MTTAVKIIGLAGEAGSGKDTVATYLAQVLPVTRVSFAEPIKRGLLAMFESVGVTEEQCFGPSHMREQPIWGVGTDVTVRHCLQTLGTEWGRKFVAEDIWVRVALSRCLLASTPFAVITDVRYENEMRAVLAAGGELWHVERPRVRRKGTVLERLWAWMRGRAADHSSEVDCSSTKDSPIMRLRTCHIHNNGTLSALQAQVERAAVVLGRDGRASTLPLRYEDITK